MASGGNNNVDNAELTLLLISLLLLAIFWGLWVAAKQPIMEGIRAVKWAELAVFQLIDPALARERELLYRLNNDQATVNQLDKMAAAAKKKANVNDYTVRGLLAPDVLWGVSNTIGAYTRWPIAAIFFGCAIFYMFYSKRTKFRTHYDLEGLIRLQAGQWPVITPIVKFNPSDNNARNPGEAVPQVLPLFAEALSPEEWVSFAQIPIVNKLPEKDALRRAFQQQLGPRWTGLACLTPAQRCLFAAFALKGVQKRKESDTLLGRIALDWDAKAGFIPSAELLAEVNRIIGDDAIGGAALKVADHFAFRTTALLGVLKWARDRGGVLAPATFVWLRAHDRPLWYPLNNLGRRSYHAEAAGAMAHYMAEKTVNRPLPIPRLETAIFTLTQYWGRPEFELTKGPIVPPQETGKKKKGKST